jgi:hypothetical protein
VLSDDGTTWLGTATLRRLRMQTRLARLRVIT